MFIPVDSENQNRKWDEYTLLVAAVSVGNVGQLTADLLISTLFMDRIGHVFHESLLPIVGNDPFSHAESKTCKIVTSCDVYISMEHKLLIMQQRAPFVRGKMKMFKDWLVSFIREKNFLRVIIMTSSYGEERLDCQLFGDQFRYLFSPKLEKKCGPTMRDYPYEWIELEKRYSFPAPTPEEIKEGKAKATTIYIPGGGIAKSLYEDLLDDDREVAVVLVFCSEGDNIQDSIALATKLNRWMDMVDLTRRASIVDPNTTKFPGWRIPSSWKHMFGSSFDQSLFH